jgi:heat shock protein HslJ
MKKLLFSLWLVSIAATSDAQKNDSILITGEEYLPVEVRGETPGKLEGAWILTSGVRLSNTGNAKKYYKPKPEPGTELSKQSSSTTTNKDGVKTTTTETEVRMVMDPGPQITPPQKKKLHKPDSPSINFYGENQTFSGFTGCNKFSGRYSSKGNKLSLTDANPSTKMVCIGDYDEKEFLKKLESVTSFKITGGKLQMMNNNDVILVFARK